MDKLLKNGNSTAKLKLLSLEIPTVTKYSNTLAMEEIETSSLKLITSTPNSQTGGANSNTRMNKFLTKRMATPLMQEVKLSKAFKPI